MSENFNIVRKAPEPVVETNNKKVTIINYGIYNAGDKNKSNQKMRINPNEFRFKGIIEGVIGTVIGGLILALILRYFKI